MTPLSRAGIILACVGLATATLVAPAGAVPSPDTGPTTGGTTITSAVPAAGDLTFSEVVAGREHTLAIGSDGQVYAWGSNARGQIGPGFSGTSAVGVFRVDIADGFTATAVAAGEYHSVAIGTDGSIYSWGDNAQGQLGRSIAVVNAATPGLVTLPGGATAKAATAGSAHTVVIGADDRVYSWGDNFSGQLGRPTSGRSDVNPGAVTLPGGDTARAVSAGFSHVLAVGVNGSLYAWGGNGAGQLARTGGPSTTPVSIALPGGTTAETVAAGFFHNLVVTADDRLVTWGSTTNGKLGRPTNGTSDITPTAITLPAGGGAPVRVGAGDQHSAAVDSTGTVLTWGETRLGKLGRTTAGTSDATPAPVSLGTDTTATMVTAGFDHTVALSSEGRILTWGHNGFNQLGRSTTGSFSAVPTALTKAAPEVTVTKVEVGGLPTTGLTQTDGSWSATTTESLQCGAPVDVVVSYTAAGSSEVLEQTFEDAFSYTGTAPSITSQPASSGITAGETFTTSVAADGHPVAAVQWQSAPLDVDTWTDVPGATSTTLTATPTASTRYRAVLTSCAGTVTSDPATATVTQVPVDPEPPTEWVESEVCPADAPVPDGYTLITGTSRGDTLRGTSGPDLIRAGAGNDTVHGLGGDDIVCGGTGNDTVLAGAGNDTVFGGAGNDIAHGEAGDDVLHAGAGNDRLDGGAGTDTAVLGRGNSTLVSIERRR